MLWSVSVWFGGNLRAETWPLDCSVLSEEFHKQTKFRLPRAGVSQGTVGDLCLAVPRLLLRQIVKAKIQTIFLNSHFTQNTVFLLRTPHPDGAPGQRDGSCLAHHWEGSSDHEQKLYENWPSVQIQSAFFYWETAPPPGIKPQVLLSVMGDIWPRTLRNLIYLWWLISALLSIQAGHDSWCLVLIQRFVLLLSHLPVFLSLLPVSLFCLPSMCCGNSHWRLCGQGTSFGFNKKVWLLHLAQQVPALCLGQASPFELQKNPKNSELQQSKDIIACYI